MKNARLSLDSARVVGSVDDRLFGSFLEHLGRAVYTGIHEPGHPAADAQGFRKDVLALVRELGVPVVRYPGGNFVSGYDWRDGIGPVEKRPRRLEQAWTSVEPNRVGIDEFADWCRKAGTAPMLAVNLGTLGPDEARQEVEYCNHPGGTAWSDLRRANGHPDPHGVKLWCLGNEMDGPWQIGHKTAEEYGRIACETAKTMKWADPSIELVACGSSGRGMATFPDWERIVLEHTYEHVDYISLHTYYGNPKGDVGAFLAESVGMERFIREVGAACDFVKAKKRGTKDVKLSFDEWNVWFHSGEQDRKLERWQEAPPLLEDVYDMTDALVVGTMLNALLRNADRVKVACLAQLVNVIAPIMTRAGGPSWRQTTFWPFALASRYGRGTSLGLALDGPTYDATNHADVPWLDVSAVRDDATGAVSVFAVNRSLDEGIELALDLRGLALADGTPIERTELRSDDLSAVNDEAHPDRVAPATLPSERLDGGRATVRLAPASWNLLRIGGTGEKG